MSEEQKKSADKADLNSVEKAEVFEQKGRKPITVEITESNEAKGTNTEKQRKETKSTKSNKTKTSTQSGKKAGTSKAKTTAKSVKSGTQSGTKGATEKKVVKKVEGSNVSKPLVKTESNVNKVEVKVKQPVTLKKKEEGVATNNVVSSDCDNKQDDTKVQEVKNTVEIDVDAVMKAVDVSKVKEESKPKKVETKPDVEDKINPALLDAYIEIPIESESKKSEEVAKKVLFNSAVISDGVDDLIDIPRGTPKVQKEEVDELVEKPKAIAMPETTKKDLTALDALDIAVLASQKARAVEAKRAAAYKRKEAEALSRVDKEGDKRRAYLEELRRQTRENDKNLAQKPVDNVVEPEEEHSVKNTEKQEESTVEKNFDRVVQQSTNIKHSLLDMAYIKYIIIGTVFILLCVVGLIVIACKEAEPEYRAFYNQKLLNSVVDTVVSSTGSGFVDTDNDRLSDIEEEKLGTDFNKADTDGDGVIDGVEVYYGFDPLVADNFDNGVDIISTIDNCKVIASGDKNIFDLRLAKIDSASMRGTIGILSDIYSIVDLNIVDSKGAAKIEISNVDSNGSTKVLARYSVDKFEPVNCVVTNDVVSADITESGVYCVIDSNKYAPDSGYDIMFLIDNSGSMYSAEDCKNSDENDVDFKRVDFVEQFIDNFPDKNTRYAVATFTRDYSLLFDYTSEKSPIVTGMDLIRSPEHMPYFNGTDIENALMHVLDKVDTTRRNIIVLITDGMNTDKISAITQEDVVAKCAESNTTIISVALGESVDKEALSYYVDKTHGVYVRLSNSTEFDNALNLLNGYLDQKKHKVEFSKLLADVEPEESLELLATADSTFKPERDSFDVRWLNINDVDMTRGYAVFISQYEAGKLSYDSKINIANLFDMSLLDCYRDYTKSSEPWVSYENKAVLNDVYKQSPMVQVLCKPYSDDLYVWSGWASIQNFLHKNKNITEFEYLTLNSDNVEDIQLQHIFANIAKFNKSIAVPLAQKSQLLNCISDLRDGVPIPVETQYGVGLLTKMYQNVEDGTTYALQVYSFRYGDYYNIRVCDYYGELVYDSSDDYVNMITMVD